jgi:hypothetical protein
MFLEAAAGFGNVSLGSLGGAEEGAEAIIRRTIWRGRG